MFAATTTSTSKFDYRSKLQQSLDRDAARTQHQEVGLDDAACVTFDSKVDASAPLFRTTSKAPRLFEIDFAGEWMRA